MATTSRLPQRLALLSCLAALAACEGTNDLTAGSCLPLKAPAPVALLQEAGLYRLRDQATLVLAAHPRSTTNDGFHGMALVRTLAPGTRLEIERLAQATGFDTGKGRISAFGKLAGGERFEYGWGSGTAIGRAPWEPASVPNLRTVDCKG